MRNNKKCDKCDKDAKLFYYNLNLYLCDKCSFKLNQNVLYINIK